MYTLSTLLPFIDFQTGVLGALVAFLIYFGLSLGLFIMAISMKLKSAWMAWFPILRMFLVGKAIDFIQAQNGKKSKHGGLLLLVRVLQQLSVWLPPVLSVLLILSILLPLVGAGAAAYFYVTGDFGLIPVGAESLFDAETIQVAIGSTGIDLPAWLILTVGIILAVIIVAIPVTLFVTQLFITTVAPYLAILFTVYYHTGLYYCFAAMCKRRAPLCTVLSIFFDFAAPLLLPIACIGGLDKEWKPISKKKGAVEDAPAEEETPAIEAPAEEEAPVEEEAPTAEEAPAEEEAPAAVESETEFSISDQFLV